MSALARGIVLSQKTGELVLATDADVVRFGNGAAVNVLPTGPASSFWPALHEDRYLYDRHGMPVVVIEEIITRRHHIQVDATTFGDVGKTYLQGLPETLRFEVRARGPV